MTAESAHPINGGSGQTDSGRRNRRRGATVALVVTVSLVAMSCGGSQSSSSTVPSSTSTTSTTAVPSPVCDSLVEAVGTMLTGDGAADWSSMVATLGAVTPQLPEDLRSDWMIVVDRLSTMASGPGAAPLDLNDPASVQRYAEQLMSAEQPGLARALGNIQAFVEASCPL
ncbi:MAG: hypothetical protein ACKOIA_01535 [Acidimicrobiia bacterium]